MVPLILIALLALQAPGNSRVQPFAQRVNEFEARAKALAAAVDNDARGRASLAWLIALDRLLKAIPSGRPTGEHAIWLDAHPSLAVYNEPGGQWMIPLDVIWQAHAQHANTSSAEALAWMAVTNGLGGECEGYVPCYASRLNALNGEYLRRRPSGAHVDEVLKGIHHMFGPVLDELMAKPFARDFLDVPKDCVELQASLQPLRAAVAGASSPSAAATLTLVDRLSDRCPR